MKTSWLISIIVIVLVGLGIWSLSKPISPSTKEADVPQTQTLPILATTFPEIDGIASWINSEALTKDDLKGKVVLIDFWTYSCINCIRTLPYMRDWWTKYQDENFVLIGMHAPEFAFEKERGNVIAAAEKYGLTYPIAQDNDHVTWNNFNNRYWPAKYLFDQEGRLRYFHFGEGNYDETEAAIQELLAVKEDMSSFGQPDYTAIKSPETYFGYWRSEHFASSEPVVRDAVATYSPAKELAINEWDLEGKWVVAEQYAEAQEAGARFRFRYDASKANVVMAIKGGTIQEVIVSLDGKRIPSSMLGAHVQYIPSDDQTIATISTSDLYELIAGSPGEHVLEIETLGEGLQIYAITFG